MSEVPYFEFHDPDDPESDAHPTAKDRTSFKLGIEPQMFLVGLIEQDHVKMLPPDALPSVKQLMQASYLQGKRVGQQMSDHDEQEAS